MIHHTSCPVCHSEDIAWVLTSKDHVVTGENFDIWECKKCSLRFTQDTPPEEQIGRYYKSQEYISHTSTQKGIINRLYHAARSITLRNKKNLIKSVTHLSVGNLLDLGAGTGAFVHHMQREGWGVIGLEPDEGARLLSTQQYGVKLETPDRLFGFTEKMFDAITLWHVIEHVHALHEYVKHVKRILKDDGKIFLAAPNYYSFDARTYGERWAAYDVPRHLYHFSPPSMKQLLIQHSLQLEQVKPMWFDSFYVSLLSEKYQKKPAALVKGFFTGLISNGKALMNRDQSSSLIYIAGKAP